MQHFKPSELAPDVKALFDKATVGLDETIDKGKKQRAQLHETLNANLAEQAPLREKEQGIRDKIRDLNPDIADAETKKAEAVRAAMNTNPKMAKAMLQVLIDG